MKRSAFTLMELMIAFSLAVVVLGILFASLYQSSVLNAKLEKGEATAMARAHIQERLDQIFANTAHEKGVHTDKLGVLHFYFNNGIDSDPHFSDLCRGTLEIKNKNLVLCVQGRDKRREEKLLRDVKSIEAEFFYLEGENIMTCNEWEEDVKENPFYLKLSIDDASYIFWINHKERMEIPLK